MSTSSNTFAINQTSTLKSAALSIGLHALFVALFSFAFYQNSLDSLELTGSSGASNGTKTISLSGINFISKNENRNIVSTPNTPVIIKTKTLSTSAPTTSVLDQVSSLASSASMAANGGNGSVNGTAGTSTGTGTGTGDFDQGQLFAQIKNFFDSRLGPDLELSDVKVFKLRLMLNAEGEVLAADMIQAGSKLEASLLRRIFSIAKSIPLKNLWKSSRPFPKELIIPFTLTPNN